MPDLITIIETAGLFGVAAIIFAESGLFFGFFFPGDSLLFTAGFLASQGYFDVWLALPLFAIAAIAGDSVGYWTGKKVGPILFTRPDSFFFREERVLQAKLFFEQYGARSVVLARFIPAVRTFTPIVAGVASMSYRTFITYNIIGGLLWSIGLTLGGFFLGSVIPDADRYIYPIVGVIIVLSLFPLARQYLARMCR